MDMDDFFIPLLIVVLALGLFLIGVFNGNHIDIETKKPLEYKLKIEVENGVSDTTYIYER